MVVLDITRQEIVDCGASWQRQIGKKSPSHAETVIVASKPLLLARAH
jgi:hypothetical protein